MTAAPRRRTGASRHGWPRIFRSAPTLFQRCLAIHMASAGLRDHRQPKTALGKLGHALVGMVLGAVVATIVVEWIAGATK